MIVTGIESAVLFDAPKSEATVQALKPATRYR